MQAPLLFGGRRRMIVSPGAVDDPTGSAGPVHLALWAAHS